MIVLALFAGFVLVIPGPLWAGPSDAASLCVTNSSAERYHFTVRGIGTDGAASARIQRDLDPDQTLCLGLDGRGVVAAFESAHSLEGCSRLVPPGGSETLRVFGRFDRCAWGGSGD
jgi:hypothetical protein